MNDKGTLKEQSLNNLSLVYQKQGEYDQAIAVLEEALENQELASKNYNLYAKVIDNRAYNRFLKGDTVGVLADFIMARGIREELDNDAGIVISDLHLGELFLQRKDSARALGYASEAYALSTAYGLNRDILNSLKLLSRTEPRRAGGYLLQYARLNDSLLLEERKVQDKFTRIQYETEGYIAENRELQKRNVWISVAGVLAASSMLLLLLSYRQRSKNKQLLLEKEQQDANVEIYNLMLRQQTEMEEGRIQERVRISEELHDGALARLFGVRLGFGFLNLKGEEEDESKYDSLLQEMQSVEQEIRNLSHALKKDELSSSKDFPLLISSLMKEQSRIGNFNYKLVQDNSIAWDKIADELKINLYRIVQEALINIIKYARCSHVEVSITLEKQTVQLLIRDDGQGFDTEKKHKGIGLKNMRSRARSIGANLTVESEKEVGTTVITRIATKTIYQHAEI